MASIFGRAIIVPKTNKSGGSVAKGDVVVVDSANDNAITTTTTSATTVTVGVVVEENGIANNATGRVQFGGHVALVNVNASVTRGHYGKTHTVAKQATDAGASRVVGTFCVFTTGGTTPEADLFAQPDASSATGNVATDAIWDAAGDLAVGTGADTAARLAIGNAGGALSRINGSVAWNAGTAFPTAAAGDRYWRTDLGLEAYYDGTRWLTVTQYRQTMNSEPAQPIAANGTPSRWAGINDGTDMWIDRLEITTYANGLDASNYWTIDPLKGTAAESETSLGSFNQSADTTANWIRHTVTVGALFGTTYRYIRLSCTKTNAPGNLYTNGTVVYRLVLT